MLVQTFVFIFAVLALVPLVAFLYVFICRVPPIFQLY
jgi:hypothetical protein